MSLSAQTTIEAKVAQGLAAALASFNALRRDNKAYIAGLHDCFDGYARLLKSETDRLGYDRESYLSGYSDGYILRATQRYGKRR
jgi:hypothetical protein